MNMQDSVVTTQRPLTWFARGLSIVALLASTTVWAQPVPYVGYAFPAGGQQDTTVDVKIGGQRIDGAHQVLITGEGVTGTVEKVYRTINPQERTLLREQFSRLTKKTKGKKPAPLSKEGSKVLANVQDRVKEYCNRPASASIADLAFVKLTISSDAEPGPRELRLVTPTGVTNPLVIQVGQLTEVVREPMLTSDMQVLGKEELALRKRPEDQAELAVEIPCTVNGQIASGEVNRYRFQAKQGQQLVIACAARQLIPYIADAVPGWFQPVVSVLDSQGNELAYNDDFHFHPDPTLRFEVPKDGEYRVQVYDAIHRGREDFIYRVSIGELPFLTNVFPLGGTEETLAQLNWQGWNVAGGKIKLGPRDEKNRIQWVSVVKDGIVSNRLPFQLSPQKAMLEEQPNDTLAEAQQVNMPIVVDGQIDQPGDWDVYKIAAKAGQPIVAEVTARRLDSPLDSILKVTDAKGKLIIANDDHADVGSGINTHHADSYLMFEPPADGPLFVHVGDTTASGGDGFAYRLRLSRRQPDFELRVTPSGVGVRNQSTANFTVYAIRRDGFAGDIQIRLKAPGKAFSMTKATLKPGRDSARLRIKANQKPTGSPADLSLEGVAKIHDKEIVRTAVPADDRMQAFLWRHLVPAQSWTTLVLDPSQGKPVSRPEPPPKVYEAKDPNAPAPQLKFSKRQVESRLRQLKYLYEHWLLTERFYAEKVAECKAIQ